MFVVALALAPPMAAQTVVAPASSPALPIVRVNISSRAFETPPPFDQRFAIAIKLPAGAASITLLEYGPAEIVRMDDATMGPRLTSYKGGEITQPMRELVRGDDAVFHIQPMPANRQYLFRFVVNPARFRARRVQERRQRPTGVLPHRRRGRALRRE